MKSVFSTIAIVLAAQSSMAQSMYCAVNESADGMNYSASTAQPTKIDLTPGTTATLKNSTQKITAYVQVDKDNRYTLSLVDNSNGTYDVIAFSLASSLEAAGLFSAKAKVGISCSKAL